MIVRVVKITLVAVGLGISGTRLVAQTAPAQIPPVHSTSLTGEKVDLPGGLKGKVGVLVLGFSHDSRDNVASWGKRLHDGYNSSTTVLYYEMPMLESVPGMLRGFVTKKIAESVPDAGKSRFLPIVDHEKDWKKLTGYKSGDDAYIVVVDSTGTVRWKLQGAASEANYTEAKRQIEAAR